MDWLTPHDHPDHDAVTQWQSLVDRGLIGRPVETSPAVALNRQRTEALFVAPHRRTALQRRRERRA